MNNREIAQAILVNCQFDRERIDAIEKALGDKDNEWRDRGKKLFLDCEKLWNQNHEMSKICRDYGVKVEDLPCFSAYDSALSQALSQNLALRGALEEIHNKRFYENIAAKEMWDIANHALSANPHPMALDSKLSMVELMAHNAQLREALEDARNAIEWCGGSQDFGPGGLAAQGWESVALPAIRKADEALANPHPMPGIARLAKATYKKESLERQMRLVPWKGYSKINKQWSAAVKEYADTLEALTPAERAILEGV